MEIQPLAIHKFFFFLLNAYYVLERWKMGYSFISQKEIYCTATEKQRR